MLVVLVVKEPVGIFYLDVKFQLILGLVRLLVFVEGKETILAHDGVALVYLAAFDHACAELGGLADRSLSFENVQLFVLVL